MGDDILIIKPEDFPRRLKEIPDPPKELYIRGPFPDEDLIFLTIVGSRKYTTYGKDVCEKLIASLRGTPVVIISGLAIGMDTLVHESALKAGLKNIGVPGGGISRSVIYPRRNLLLSDEILKSGGCLLSEYKPDFRPTLWSFPRRNRIMSGLSDAVLIIEAEEKSGTLITSRLATEYNRNVLAVPGNITSSSSKGTNMLIRLGATPITSPEDLIEALGINSLPLGNQKQKENTSLSPLENKILEILNEPKSRDQIFYELDFEESKIMMSLSLLEMKGLIKEELGEVRRMDS